MTAASAEMPLAHRDVIVVGASAGGVESLQRLVAAVRLDAPLLGAYGTSDGVLGPVGEEA